jgi:hypothetical protein
LSAFAEAVGVLVVGLAAESGEVAAVGTAVAVPAVEGTTLAAGVLELVAVAAGEGVGSGTAV